MLDIVYALRGSDVAVRSRVAGIVSAVLRKHELRDRVVKHIRRATSHIRVADTRLTLLALSEISRRADGDTPTKEVTLTPYELRVFSQNGEDGVIAEILRRTGTGTRYFVEFGASSGLEANCVLLADVCGWNGLFIERDPAHHARLQRKYRGHAGVSTTRAIVTPDNVEALFTRARVPHEPDVLSIDIDGGDYYVWEAIVAWRPRVVVIEYNSGIEHERRLVQPRDAGEWDETAFFGASIGALRTLGESKGYRLVHTELTGCNAFFVRADLPGEFPDAADVPLRSSNYFLAGLTHFADPRRRPFIDLDALSVGAARAAIDSEVRLRRALPGVAARAL